MQKNARNTAISAMLALGLVAFPAPSGANPWNPFPTQAPANAAGPALQVPIVQPQGQPAARSRFAPSGLEQQLAATPFLQYAPTPGSDLKSPNPRNPNTGTLTGATTGANPAGTPPPTYAPAPQGYAGAGGFAPQGYQFNPYAPAYSQGGYAPYPQIYGGYPGGYGNYGNQGFGGNTPFSPLGFPAGPGGFNPFPGTLTNGGIPGFNVSPFGFF